MKKILLLLVATSSYASLMGRPPTNPGSGARQINPLELTMNVAPPPPYNPAYNPAYNPEPSAPTASMFERVEIQNQQPSTTHRSQPSQSAQQQRSPHCKCAAAVCLTPAALLDTLLIACVACANEQEYGEDPLGAWSGDTSSAPDNYLCRNQYAFTKALLNIAFNCNYQTCIKCDDENASN